MALVLCSCSLCVKENRKGVLIGTDLRWRHGIAEQLKQTKVVRAKIAAETIEPPETCLQTDIRLELKDLQESIKQQLKFLKTYTPDRLVFNTSLSHNKMARLCDRGLATSLLQHTHWSNRVLIDHHSALVDAQNSLNQVISQDVLYEKLQGLKQQCQQDIESGISQISIILHKELARLHLEQHNSAYGRIIDTGRYCSTLQRIRDLEPVYLIVILCVAVLHLMCSVAQPASQWLLKSLKMLLLLILDAIPSNEIEKKYLQGFISDIPQDIRTVLDRLDLAPITTTFVCCSKCYALYPGDTFPETCCFKAFSSSIPCGTSLMRQKHLLGTQTAPVAVRKYLYQDLAQWLGRLLMRPGLERAMDEAPERISQDGYSRDMWDSLALQEFCGPDGKSFCFSNSLEGRYIFGLAFDGFNPFHLKEAGKKVSVGAIYLTCLNLPISIRLKVENILLVGIVPGPNKPSLTQLNHLLEPLIDDLLLFWDPGVFYTSTPNFPNGRVVRVALIPLVSDLLATRQLEGRTAATSTCFCDFCGLQWEDIEETDPTKWPPRMTSEEHRSCALQWQNAETQKARDELVKKNGVRWSVLLRLPYWEPRRHVLFDTTHGFFLGTLARHCRTVWGMDLQLHLKEKSSIATIHPPTLLEMDHLNTLITAKTLLSQLSHVRKCVLVQLCRERDLRDTGNKKRLAKNLLENAYNLGNSFEGEMEVPEQTTNKHEPTDAELLLGQAKLKTAQSLKKLRYAILASLCKECGIYDKKDTRKHMLEKLTVWRADPTNNNHPLAQSGEIIHIERRERPERILGKELADAADTVRLKMQLPSWAPRPPQLTSTSHGKFKADEWRITCLCLLVFTAIQCWSGKPEKVSYLDNFMHMITAIKIATSPTISVDSPTEYTTEWTAYLKGLKELYPHVAFAPNQHISYHVGELLKDWGPVLSWRGNSTERYNRFLQDRNTNWRFGVLFREFP